MPQRFKTFDRHSEWHKKPNNKSKFTVKAFKVSSCLLSEKNVLMNE